MTGETLACAYLNKKSPSIPTVGTKSNTASPIRTAGVYHENLAFARGRGQPDSRVRATFLQRDGQEEENPLG
jgi:hypothetical protein